MRHLAHSPFLWFPVRPHPIRFYTCRVIRLRLYWLYCRQLQLQLLRLPTRQLPGRYNQELAVLLFLAGLLFSNIPFADTSNCYTYTFAFVLTNYNIHVYNAVEDMLHVNASSCLSFKSINVLHLNCNTFFTKTGGNNYETLQISS